MPSWGSVDIQGKMGVSSTVDGIRHSASEMASARRRNVNGNIPHVTLVKTLEGVTQVKMEPGSIMKSCLNTINA